MSSGFVYWPTKLLVPITAKPRPSPFSRSGGRTLGGIARHTRTDRGFWQIDFAGISLRSSARKQVWNAIRTQLGGMAGLLVVPAWSFDTAPWPGTTKTYGAVTHSDDTSFSDGSRYRQRTIAIDVEENIPIGATTAKLRLINGAASLNGIRWSHRNALYENGSATLVSGAVWTVPIFPACREAIPAGARVEADIPTCLVHLASDQAMSENTVRLGATDNAETLSVSFVEAVDYWNDLAAAA